jgi:hypothetical protein
MASVAAAQSHARNSSSSRISVSQSATSKDGSCGLPMAAADRPLERLHPSHRGADHRVQAVQLEDLRREAVLCAYHVANGDFGERLVRGAESPIADPAILDDRTIVEATLAEVRELLFGREGGRETREQTDPEHCTFHATSPKLSRNSIEAEAREILPRQPPYR